MKSIDIENFNFPISVDYIHDCFETYCSKFYNLQEDLNKLENQIQISRNLEQLKFNKLCNIINSERVQEKIIGLSITFASIMYQMLGMNFRNPWRVPDGERYIPGDTKPFALSVAVTAALFVLMFIILQICFKCYMSMSLQKRSDTSASMMRSQQYIRLPDNDSEEPTISNSILENPSES